MEYPNDMVSYSSGAGGWGSERFSLLRTGSKRLIVMHARFDKRHWSQ